MNPNTELDTPLSVNQIKKILKGKANVYIYPDITKFNTLDELLNPYGSTVILYLMKPSFGHFTCINKLENGIIEFFDPYNIFPDKELNHISDSQRIDLNQSKNHLSKLMKESPYKLSYNHHAFQSKSNDIATCGKHCIMRIFFKNLSLKEYNNMIKNITKKTKISADGIVNLFYKYMRNQ